MIKLAVAALMMIASASTLALNTPDAPTTVPRTKTTHHLHTTHHAATSHHAAAVHRAAATSHTATSHSSSAAHIATTAHVTTAAQLRRRHHTTYERFTTASFVDVQGADDITAGEDPTIRAAAIAALGNLHGTAVVINPANGRILAMVNQSIALSPGAEPCSTIKLTVGMAALSEGLITRDTPVNLGGFRMTLTEALAHSNNLYFEEMGRELGFERVRHYANEFGLGELAGWQIPGEQLGTYPDQEIPAKEGGVGRMCSFGQGVSMTPLQLGAYVAAIANGGTLYYLQHPTTAEDVASFEPRVKRHLDIARYIPDMQDGMAGAVEYGTARSLRVNFHELPVFGKTGTCSDKGTRFGWFASYSDSPMGSLVTVFFLEGGKPMFGPHAAELTGVFYRNLWDHNYFGDKGAVQAAYTASPAAAGSVSGNGGKGSR